MLNKVGAHIQGYFLQLTASKMRAESEDAKKAKIKKQECRKISRPASHTFSFRIRGSLRVRELLHLANLEIAKRVKQKTS